MQYQRFSLFLIAFLILEKNAEHSHYTTRTATWSVCSTKLSPVRSGQYLAGWPTTNTPCCNNFFSFFFPFLFQGDIKGLQNCHPCVMSFLLFINFLFLISQWPYLHRISKQRDTFEFSSILSTVDLSIHLITAWIIRKLNSLILWLSVSSFSFSAIWLNLHHERALSATSSSIITGSFCQLLFTKKVRAKIYLVQSISAIRCWALRSEFKE